jgi:hypothetical protein
MHEISIVTTDVADRSFTQLTERERQHILSDLAASYPDIPPYTFDIIHDLFNEVVLTDTYTQLPVVNELAIRKLFALIDRLFPDFSLIKAPDLRLLYPIIKSIKQQVQARSQGLEGGDESNNDIGGSDSTCGSGGVNGGNLTATGEVAFLGGNSSSSTNNSTQGGLVARQIKAIRNLKIKSKEARMHERIFQTGSSIKYTPERDTIAKDHAANPIILYLAKDVEHNVLSFELGDYCTVARLYDEVASNDDQVDLIASRDVYIQPLRKLFVSGQFSSLSLTTRCFNGSNTTTSDLVRSDITPILGITDEALKLKIAVNQALSEIYNAVLQLHSYVTSSEQLMFAALVYSSWGDPILLNDLYRGPLVPHTIEIGKGTTSTHATIPAKDVLEKLTAASGLTHDSVDQTAALGNYNTYAIGKMYGADSKRFTALLTRMKDETETKIRTQHYRQEAIERMYREKIYLAIIVDKFGSSKAQTIAGRVKFGKSLLSYLSKNEAKIIAGEYEREIQRLASISGNKCPHVRLYKSLRRERNVFAVKKLLGQLRSFFTSASEEKNLRSRPKHRDVMPGSNLDDPLLQTAGMIKCGTCRFDIICPHIVIYYQMLFENKSMFDFKTRLNRFIDKTIVGASSTTYYCMICSEVIGSIDYFGSIMTDQDIDRFSTIDDELKKELYKEVRFMLNNVQTLETIDPEPLIKGVTTAIYPYVFEIDKQITKSKTDSPEIMRYKQRLFISIYAYAYVTYLMIYNPKSRLVFRSVTREKPDKSEIARAAVTYIVKDHNYIIGQLQTITNEYIKNKYLEAFNQISGNTSDEFTAPLISNVSLVVRLLLDPIYLYIYQMSLITNRRVPRGVAALTGKDMVEQIKPLLGIDIKQYAAEDIEGKASKRRKAFPHALFDKVKSVKTTPIKLAFDSYKTMKTKPLHYMNVSSGTREPFAFLCYDVFIEKFLRPELYNEFYYGSNAVSVSSNNKSTVTSLIPNVTSIGQKISSVNNSTISLTVTPDIELAKITKEAGTSNTIGTTRISQDYLDYHERLASLRSTEQIIKKYETLRRYAVTNWPSTPLDFFSAGDELVPLGEIYDAEGRIHNFNIYIYADGAEIPFNDYSALIKTVGLPVDRRCSVCKVTRSESAAIDAVAIRHTLDTLSDIKNFFIIYEHRCPVEGLHDWKVVNSDDSSTSKSSNYKCTKCQMTTEDIKRSSDNTSASSLAAIFDKYYTKYLEEYQSRYGRKISASSLETNYKVEKIDADERLLRWSFSYKQLTTLADILKLNIHTLAALGATGGQKYQDILSGKFIPSEVDSIDHSRIYLLSSYVYYLISCYNSIRYYSSKMIPEMAGLLAASNISKFEYTNLYKLLPDINSVAVIHIKKMSDNGEDKIPEITVATTSDKSSSSNPTTFSEALSYIVSSRKPREVVEFCLEQFANYCLTILADKNQVTKQLRTKFVEFVVKKILRDDEMCSSYGIINWNLLKVVDVKSETYNENYDAELNVETETDIKEEKAEDQDFGTTDAPFKDKFDIDVDPDKEDAGEGEQDNDPLTGFSDD